MKGLFSYEGAFTQGLIKLGNCIFLTLLWLISSLPVITIGASSTALSFAVKKVQKNESHAWESFWKSFKLNFRQSTLLWLVMLVVYSVLLISCYCAYVMYTSDIAPAILFLFTVVLFVAVTMWTTYVFPYVARFSNTIKAILKNCWLISLRNIGWSFLLVLLFVIFLLGIVFIPLSFVLLPAVYALVQNDIYEKVFTKYLPDEE